jgi:hypothetical protein
MAPRRLAPARDRGPQRKEPTVDTTKSSAHYAQEPRPDRDDRSCQERRSCFYCLGGWVFLGSLDHDGEEIVDSVRCRQCGGTGKLYSGFHCD